MSLYSNLAATSLKLLTKFGQDVTLRQYSQGGADYDPTTSAATPSGPTGPNDSTRKGLPIDAPASRIGPQYGTTRETGTLIVDTDKWLYLDANGVKPSLQDHVILAGTEFSIINIQEENPGGTPLLYLLVLRA